MVKRYTNYEEIECLTENPEPTEKCLKDGSAVNFSQGPANKQQHTKIGEENKKQIKDKHRE